MRYSPIFERAGSRGTSHESGKFRKLAAEVLANAKVNDAVSIIYFFKDPTQVPKKEESSERGEVGNGQYDEIIVFNNGKTLELGEFSPYYLTSPYGELYSLTKKETPVTMPGGKDDLPMQPIIKTDE